MRRPMISCAGFTLLEVLVALVIIATALGASLRAVGSLTQNSSDLRGSMMATWSAENRLTQIRLAQEWPMGSTNQAGSCQHPFFKQLVHGFFL